MAALTTMLQIVQAQTSYFPLHKFAKDSDIKSAAIEKCTVNYPLRPILKNNDPNLNKFLGLARGFSKQTGYFNFGKSLNGPQSTQI